MANSRCSRWTGLLQQLQLVSLHRRHARADGDGRVHGAQAHGRRGLRIQVVRSLTVTGAEGAACWFRALIVLCSVLLTCFRGSLSVLSSVSLFVCWVMSAVVGRCGVPVGFVCLLPLQPLRVNRYCVVVMAHESSSKKCVCACVRVCVCVCVCESVCV